MLGYGDKKFLSCMGISRYTDFNLSANQCFFIVILDAYYSLWSVTWRFWVAREGLELLTHIRDFTLLFVRSQTRVLRIVRVVYRERLRYAKSFYLAFYDFAFFKHSHRYLCLYSWFGKQYFYICYPLFFSVRKPCHRLPAPPPYDLLTSVGVLTHTPEAWFSLRPVIINKPVAITSITRAVVRTRTTQANALAERVPSRLC